MRFIAARGSKNFRAQLGVGFHRGPFVGVERAGFIQNNFRDADFADVVQQSGEAHFLDFGFVHAEGVRDHHRVCGNFLRVALGVVILRVNRESE